MENKKIINATPTNFDGIEFRSKLEKSIYKSLIDKGIQVDYEPQKCKVWDRDGFSVPYYDRYGKKGFGLITSKPIAVHYTPDMVFDYKGTKVFLEVKGFKNDVTPYKIRMFREWLDKYQSETNIKCCYAVVYAIKDVNLLLNLLDNES